MTGTKVRDVLPAPTGGGRNVDTPTPGPSRGAGQMLIPDNAPDQLTSFRDWKAWLKTIPLGSTRPPCPSRANLSPTATLPGRGAFLRTDAEVFSTVGAVAANQSKPEGSPLKARAPSMASGKRPRARTLEAPRAEPLQHLRRHHRAQQDHEGLPNPRVGRLQFYFRARGRLHVAPRGTRFRYTGAHENGTAREQQRSGD